jgi:hypothetical protein
MPVAAVAVLVEWAATRELPRLVSLVALAALA